MWKLSTNFIDKEDTRKYVSSDYTEEKDSLCKYKFRCLDDDGNVYFNGYCSSDGTDGITDDLETEAFAPLDDFGEGMYGCTEIQYKNQETGKYETL